MGEMVLGEPAPCAALLEHDVAALEAWMTGQRAELERLARRVRTVEAEADLAECSVRRGAIGPGDEVVLGTPFRGADAEINSFFWRELPSVRAALARRRRAEERSA